MTFRVLLIVLVLAPATLEFTFRMVYVAFQIADLRRITSNQQRETAESKVAAEKLRKELSDIPLVQPNEMEVKLVKREIEQIMEDIERGPQAEAAALAPRLKAIEQEADRLRRERKSIQDNVARLLLKAKADLVSERSADPRIKPSDLEGRAREALRLREAASLLEKGDRDGARMSLNGGAPDRDWDWRHLKLRADGGTATHEVALAFPVEDAVAHPDGGLLLAGAGGIHWLKAVPGAMPERLVRFGGRVHAMATHPGRSKAALLLETDDGFWLEVWDLATRKRGASAALPKVGLPARVGFHNSGDFVVLNGSDDSGRLFRARDLQALPPHGRGRVPVEKPAWFSLDQTGSHWAVVDSENDRGDVEVHSTTLASKSFGLPGQRYPVLHVPTPRRALALKDDGVLLFHGDEGSRTATFAVAKTRMPIAVFPTLRRFAVLTPQGRIEIRDLASDRIFPTLLLSAPADTQSLVCDRFSNFAAVAQDRVVFYHHHEEPRKP